MQQLTANDLVRAWESGSRRHPVDRAILLLFLACPDQSLDELWQLTIGDRNRILLSLYEQTAGERMDCIATCGHCGEKNEFTVSVDDIRYPAPTAREGQWQGGTCSVRFRQPNNLDLAAVAEIADIETARLTLARRCIVATENAERQALVDDVVAAVGDAIREQDPQVEMYFDVVCAECEQSSSVLFDVVSFVWAEVNRFAQRVLHEVHLLARAYGWREADILAMTPQRRQFYLDMIGG